MLCVVEHLNKLLIGGGLAFLFALACLAQVGAAEAGKPASPGPADTLQTPEDPYLWLEDVTRRAGPGLGARAKRPQHQGARSLSRL